MNETTKMTHNNPTVKWTLLAGFLAAITAIQAQTIEYSKLKAASGFPDQTPAARWKDPATGASLFNLAFDADGITQGENYLPGFIELPLPISDKKKITLTFSIEGRGVTAVTLTSGDGAKRFRIQEDASGITLSWRDKQSGEEPIAFRKFQTGQGEDKRTVQIIVDSTGQKFEIGDGETSETIVPNTDGTPDILVDVMEKAVASVQTGGKIYEFKIEEK